MNWKPSTGLKLAEPIVHQLDQEATLAGSHLSPIFRYRMLQVLAEALDDAVAQVSMDLGPEPPVPDDSRWAPPPTKIELVEPTEEERGFFRDRAELKPEGTQVSDYAQSVVDANGSAEPPRKRGRPKGSTGKKAAKKGKRKEKVEAAPVAGEPVPAEAPPSVEAGP